MDTVFTNAEKRTSVPFRHDVVGSFLRPAALKEARRKHEAGEITAEELRKVEDEEIIKLVQKEKEVGLKAVTDGEFRRSWWHLDFFWGLDGVERKILEKGYEFQGVKTRTDTAFITGKISCKVHPQVEHFKFLKKVAGDDVTARQNIPAPSQILFEFYRNEETIANTQRHYPNIEELYEDLANAWRNAILSFYEAGCRNLQLDDCTWGMLCDAKWREEILKVTDIPEFARGRVELNNRAIRDLPEDLTITMHTCRGNFKSTFFGTGGYQPVAETLFGRANVKAFYLEFDTERAGGFEPLQYLRDQLVVIGLFSSKLPALEDKEQIIARLKEATKYVDINRICISPQCGFASTEEGNILTEEEQWNKLRFIKEVADQIWH